MTRVLMIKTKNVEKIKKQCKDSEFKNKNIFNMINPINALWIEFFLSMQRNERTVLEVSL